jgi:hypothetical protein
VLIKDRDIDIEWMTPFCKSKTDKELIEELDLE